MKKTTITMNVPTVIVNAIDSVKQVVAWTNWRINGARCEETGELLFSRYFDISASSNNGKRIMFAAWNSCLSPEGLRLRFNRYWERKYQARDVDTNTCDCCGITRPTIDIVWAQDAKKYGENLDLRLGMEWWNGFNICSSCINEALLNSPKFNYNTTHYKNGKTFCINEFGLKKYIKHGSKYS